MYVRPTARINSRREQPPRKRDRDAIRAFAYQLGLTLVKYCRFTERAQASPAWLAFEPGLPYRYTANSRC